MPSSFYKVWAIGRPLSNGITAPLHIGVAGVAKRSYIDCPYVVVNELICNYLSRAILLPTPPGFIIRNEDVPHYVSLDFNLAGQKLPPVDPSLLVESLPEFSAGVVAFDAWVINSDRHDENLSYLKSANSAQAFDHGHCFFNGATREEAREHLENNRNSIGINNHCLLPYLDRIDHLMRWVDRIEKVPDFYIGEVISSTMALGLPEIEIDYCTDYLCMRRDALGKILISESNRFSAVPDDCWDVYRNGES